MTKEKKYDYTKKAEDENLNKEFNLINKKLQNSN